MVKPNAPHLHVVVVLAVIEWDEAESSGVHVALCLLALLGETFDTIEAHQEVPKAIVPVQGVHVLQGPACLKHDKKRFHLPSPPPRHFLFL